MEMKRFAVLPLTLLIAGTAVAASVRGLAPETLEAGPPRVQATQPINVILTCNAGGQVGIRVNPFRHHLGRDDTATWQRVGGYNGNFEIEPVDNFPWTLSNGGTSQGGEVTGTAPSGGVGDGTYYYKVKFMCDGDEVVLDPRMDVP